MKRTLALFLCLALAGTFVAMNARAQSGPGSALVFDGVNDFANVPLFATNAPTNEITIEFWQNVSSAKTQGSFSAAPDNIANRINAHVPWVDGVVYWDFGNINTSGRLQYTPPTPIVGSWQHFAFVASSNGNYMRIYRNGVLEAQKAGMTPFVRGSQDLNIGQVNGGFFAGQIDQFRVWNVARSSNEIATNFMRSLVGNEPGLLLYLRCNEGSGTQTADAAALGGNTTAFLSNGVAWAASGASVGGLFVTMADSLLIDTNNNGRANANDTLRYTITIQNNGTNTLTNLVLNVPGNTNATLVPGSVKFPPKAVNDGPATNSLPGFDVYHVFLNTVLNINAASGLLANDTLGAPAGSIASFGGGSFPGTATTTASGSAANAPNIGSLTVNANGSLTFTPTATFNGLATFQYRLTNAQGASIATATLAVGVRPVATNETYFITGNTMFDSSLGFPTTVIANDSGDLRAIASNTAGVNGTVTLNANGSFLFTPNAGYTGPASFTYTITNGFGPSIGTVNINVTNLLWYIDNSVAVNGDGRSSSPFKQTSDFTTVNDGTPGHPADNQAVWLRQGTYTGSTLLRNGQKLIGDGAPGTFFALFGFNLAQGSVKAPGVAIPAITGVRPFISVPSGTAVSLGSGNTVLGLDVHSANGRGFSGASIGNLTINYARASSAGDRVLNLNGGFAANVILDSVWCTNSVDSGITLGGLNSCTIIASNGLITGAAAADFVVSGPGSANIQYYGAINNTAGRSVDISGMTGGGVTFGGNISDTGTGLIIQNNANANIQFSGASKVFNTAGFTALTLHSNASCSILFGGGGLDVDTTTATALSIIGSNSVTVNGANNYINSTTGTTLFNSGRGGTALIDITAAIANTTGRLLDIQGRAQAQNLTLWGNLTNSGTGILIQSNSAGTMTFSGAAKVLNTGVNTALTVHTNAGAQIVFNNTGLDIDTTSSTGVSVIGGATLFQITGGNNTVNTATGTAFLNSGSGGSAEVSVNADFTSTAGRVVDIQNRTGANVTLSGNLSNVGGTGMLVQNNSGSAMVFGGLTKTFNTGANTAVNFVNNTGCTITFQNPLVITTTSGTGFNATGGGTVTVTSGGTGDTITSGTGTALNVVNTTIGASGLTFVSITANGAANGIVLNNTGVSGGLTVTGDGGGSNNGSGGTIQNTTASGVLLNSTANVNLRYMNIQNANEDGIEGVNVTGLNLNRCNVLNSGDDSEDVGIGIRNNLWGNCGWTNLVVTGSELANVFVQNDSGTLSSFNIVGGTYGNLGTAFGGNSILINMTGTAILTGGNVTGALIANNKPARGITVQAQGTIGVGSSQIGDAVNAFTVSFCTLTNNGLHASFEQSLAANLTFRFMSNGTPSVPMTMTNTASGTSHAVNVASSSTTTGGTIRGRLSGNYIGNTNVAGSGSAIGNGLRVFIQGKTASTLLIDGNVIRQTPQARGMDLQYVGQLTAGQPITQHDVTLINNNVFPSDTTGFPAAAIVISADNQGSPARVRCNVTGNTVPAGVAFDYTDDYLILANVAAGAELQLVDTTSPISGTADSELAATNTGSKGTVPPVTLIAGPITTPP